METKGLPRSRCRRPIWAKSIRVGAALGSIIAIIMIHHMMKTMTAYPGDQAIGIIIAPACADISIPAPSTM